MTGLANEVDPRFKPVSFKDEFIIVPDQWKVDFMVSMGELSLFFKELKENARLMGTRCPKCESVYFWPRSWCHDCFEDCEWVEVSQKGSVTMFSRVDISLTDLQREVPFYQGGVHLDGVRYPIVALLRNVTMDTLHRGMRVRAEFLPQEERTGRIRDFYFVPDT